MAHCPNCGTEVKNEELYCVKCGEKLPEDLNRRVAAPSSTGFNKWWVIPITTFVVSILLIIGYYFLLENQITKARQTYAKGVELAEDGQFSEARDTFLDALKYKDKFPAASQNAQFMEIAEEIRRLLNSSDQLKKDGEYQEALNLITDAEGKLNNYKGTVVNQLLDQIVQQRNDIKVAQLTYKLEQKPSVQDLKSLLWQAEAIQSEEANEIVQSIRKRIIDYSYSNANEKLKMNQFSDALAFVEDGLKYAPDSSKLKSLKTTIEKEKVAFETEQQQRIQQALNAAEKERERNKNDAVEIVSVQTKLDDYGDLVVKGEIKSVATVPIYSVTVIYHLIDKDGHTQLTNEVYVYPDTLFPDETGNFEFTHYDIDEELKADVEKVTWFLDSP
ncbi:zinc ribbon protein [Melghiribacillus thermohalophilus]|uniref:Zinc ribbon protein n=1 Tax=Melghiribacillus thermohalophilus TaxID=1324956 RepID=A0A4R3MQB5_9BACI|nr:zinc ribbon domain-containing protein [Melghiribacillus thermohalophilus]TCT18075.1 zinc ribbon protein [Melghiribacillus thermohalophilus]